MSGETDRRIEQLLAALRDDNEALRDHAVASLGQLGGAAIERLINLFADEDRVIREAARQAGVQGGADAGPALPEAPRGDDWGVREPAAEAARALKKIPDPRAVDGLLRGLASGNWIVKRHAAEALGLIGDSRALDGLREALRDEDWLVRRNAAESLARLGDRRAVEDLLPLLEEENDMVRGTAEGAPSRLGLTPPTPSRVCELAWLTQQPD